jgi:hypothetical protein
MLASETVVEMVAEHLDRSWLSSSVAADCVSRVLDLQAAGHWAGSSSLLNAEQNVEVAALISELVLKPLPEKQIDMAASDCLASLERSAVERRLGELRKRLSQKGMPIGELVKVQQQVLDLRRQLDNIPPLSMRKKELSRH